MRHAWGSVRVAIWTASTTRSSHSPTIVIRAKVLDGVWMACTAIVAATGGCSFSDGMVDAFVRFSFIVVKTIVQRAYATLADRILSNSERVSEGQRGLSIHDVFQSLRIDVAKRRMEETGAHRAIDLNYGRHPRSIAEWRFGRELAEMCAKMAGKPAQLRGAFGNVSRTYVFDMQGNKLFNLIFEGAHFLIIQGNLCLSFHRPQQWSIECFGGQVSRQKRDGIDFKCLGGGDRGPQTEMIGLLHCTAAGYLDISAMPAKSGDSILDEMKGTVHATDRVMDLRGTVNRNDYVIEERGYFLSAFQQQQASGKERQTDVFPAEEAAK